MHSTCVRCCLLCNFFDLYIELSNVYNSQRTNSTYTIKVNKSVGTYITVRNSDDTFIRTKLILNFGTKKKSACFIKNKESFVYCLKKKYIENKSFNTICK